MKNEKDMAYPVNAEALSAHYKEVASFQAARVKMTQRISKWLMVLAALAFIGNIVQGITIASLVPLAKIVPVYLWVRQDGTIDDSVTMSQLPATQSEAVKDAALWEYVRLRESYSPDTAAYNYGVVSQMSTAPVQQAYQQFFNYPNPVSPQVTVGKKGTILADHISTADLAANLVQIRFRRTVAIQGAQPDITTWTATIKYAMAVDMPASARLNNPGGVIITSYQASEDTAQ